MKNKVKLVEALNDSRNEVRGFVAGLSVTQRSAAGTVDHWAAKDVVAHLTAWILYRVEDLELAAQPSGKPDDRLSDDDHLDETNAHIFAQYQNLSWEEILAFTERAYASIIAYAQAATPEELDDNHRIPWRTEQPFWRILVGNAVEHALLHLSYYHIDNGNPAAAGRIQEARYFHMLELDDSPTWRGTQMYNLACIQALTGEEEKALANLREALRLSPNLVEWSKQDPDLVGLHDHPAYQALYDS